jgi:hypothetical protein
MVRTLLSSILLIQKQTKLHVYEKLPKCQTTTQIPESTTEHVMEVVPCTQHTQCLENQLTYNV